MTTISGSSSLNTSPLPKGFPHNGVRFLHICISLYIAAALLYTTDHLILSPLRNCAAFRKEIFLDLPFIRSFRITPSNSVNDGIALLVQNQLSWKSSSLVLKAGLGHSTPIAMDDSLFLSKVFANSMKPSKIMPFYYRATGVINKLDITVTTLITSNRFQVFSRLVENYKGPVSVTIHIANPSHYMREIEALHNLYTSSDIMAKYVDVHLVVDAFDRQFNTWRNIARVFARTDYVMMLDIDFALCTDFRTSILGSKKLMAQLRSGSSAFVIPALEYSDHQRVDADDFPRNKLALLDLVRKKKIAMFHSFWQPGHNSTDYPRFYRASAGESYEVTEYQSAYEPYVIFKKEGPPWCDERFVGYGGNKAACLFEMYLSGISFYVLSDHFIIHQNHLYEENARRNERRINRKLYSNFKEETCLRYLKRYHENKSLDVKARAHAFNECKKIKAIAKMIEQYRGF